MNADNILGYVIVSDLHLGPGRRPETPYVYKREEDFFFDNEFSAFLTELEEERKRNNPSARWRLIINGDLVEFMQIMVWPQLRGGRWELWPGTTVPMFATEQDDGLATTPPKSAWKLEVVAQGHPTFFQALAKFLRAGNDLVITKGNHDAEFHWPEVRKQFVQILVRALDPQGDATASLFQKWDTHRFVDKPERIWPEGGNLQFFEFSYCDGPLYVEHGNQHEPANEFLDFERPVHPLFRGQRGGETFLEFPFGSIFVRYFFNEVEKHFSYADNVKPTTETIREIWSKHRWLTIEILAKRISPLVRALTFPPVWIRLRRVVKPAYGTYVLLAVYAVFWQLIQAIRTAGFTLEAFATAYEGWKGWFAIAAVVLPIAADLFSQQDERYLRRAAARHYAAMKATRSTVRYFAYGHTHDPDIWRIGREEAWYYNTGTWTTVFSQEERLIRRPQQFVFLKVVREPTSPSGWEANLGYWDPHSNPGQRPLVLEEDKQTVKLKSRGYLAEAGLPTPPRTLDERISLAAQVWNAVGVPVKRTSEALLGIPAWLLWSATCIVAHLIRPFWRFGKNIVSLRFAKIGERFARDWELMVDWFRVSWRILWRAS